MAVTELPVALWWQVVSRQHSLCVTPPHPTPTDLIALQEGAGDTLREQPSALIYLQAWECLIFALYAHSSLQILHRTLRKPQL